MAIKWKKCKEWLNVKKNNLIVAIVFFVVSAINFMYMFPNRILHYSRSPVIVVTMFLCSAISIVFFTRVGMMNVVKKAEAMEKLEFGRYYFKVFVIELIICAVYVLIVTLYLRTPGKGYDYVVDGVHHNQYLGTVVDDWDNHGIEWLKWLVYIVPIAASVITVIVESERARNNRVGLLDARLRHEQKLASEEKNKAKQEQVKAVEEQNKANQLSIDLLTNVTHDLKTPLTAIIGYLALMEKEELTPVMSDYVKVVMQKSEMLKEMIDKILELSKASSKKAALDMKRLNLNKLVLQLVSDIEQTYPEKKILFETKLSEEDIFFIGDDMYAYRIGQNLLDNAVKYSLEGTRIYVKTYKSEGKVYLEVINVSAYPIENDESELKGKFVRGDKSRNTEGNGLGLAIVDAYTQALGGEFNIDIVGDTFRAVVAIAIGDGVFGSD